MQPIHFPGQGFIPGKTPFTCAKPQSDDAGEAKTPVSNYAINDGTLPRSGLVQWALCSSVRRSVRGGYRPPTILPRTL
jgi:hypothetical protein